MANGNPFYIRPMGGVDIGGNVLRGLQVGQAAKRNRMTMEQAEREQAAREAAQGRRVKTQQAFASKDPALIRQAIIEDPEYAQEIRQGIQAQFHSPESNQVYQVAANEIRKNPDNFLQIGQAAIRQLEGMGADTTQLRQDMERFATMSREERQSEAETAFLLSGGNIEEQARKWKPVPDAPGYLYDENTGETRLQPKVRASIMADAQKKAQQEKMLKPKDVADVSNKVTTILKPTTQITRAARDLAALEAEASPAAQLAAVFKFMKANDPTSTVRESEQGQVYSAEGVMQGFANRLNQAMGEGGLSESGFRDLVRTAQTLANSAIESSQSEVQDYLSVLSDVIEPEDMEKIQDRVPELFDIEEREQFITDPTPEDIQNMDQGTIYEVTQPDGSVKQYRRGPRNPVAAQFGG